MLTAGGSFMPFGTLAVKYYRSRRIPICELYELYVEDKVSVCEAVW